MPDLWSIALLLFLLCASAGIGYLVKSRLPERHRSRESIELTQLGITLLATFAAIVLGLLTTSVKAGYDAAYTARGTYAAEFAQLDQCLREYGPETAPIREKLQSYAAAVIASTWPDEKPPAGVRYPDTSTLPFVRRELILGAIINAVGQDVLELQPADPLRQRILNSMRAGIFRSGQEPLEGDRGGARIDLGALLLGAGVLARDPVRLPRPQRSGRPHGGHRHRPLGDFDHGRSS